MSGTKITQKQEYSVVQNIANLQSYQGESNGNQDQVNVYVNITMDGSHTVGQVIIGSDNGGNVLFNSVLIRARSGGGVDFFNGTGTKIMSLDLKGNLRCLGTITPSVAP